MNQQNSSADVLNINIWELDAAAEPCSLTHMFKNLASSFEETGKRSNVAQATRELIASFVTSSDNLPQKGSYTVAMPLPIRVRAYPDIAYKRGYVTVKPVAGWPIGVYVCPARLWLQLSNPAWRLVHTPDGELTLEGDEGSSCTAKFHIACQGPLGPPMSFMQKVTWDRLFEANEKWDYIMHHTVDKLISALNP